MNETMNDDRDDEEKESALAAWWRGRIARVRPWVVRLRQRIALAIWTSDGRLPGGVVGTSWEEDIMRADGIGDAYDVTIRYAEGAVIRLRGACSRDRTRRLTGFMSVYEEPYYQILVVGGARLDVDTSRGPLVGQAIATHGVGVGVFDHSMMIVKNEGDIRVRGTTAEMYVKDATEAFS